MTTLALIITDAGRQAIIDETNGATLPVTISELAYGDGTWTPDATATALNNEVKRITSLGSNQATAPDTISVTATDSSTDTYTVREIGLYTDGGVLFAIYAQATPILTKAIDAASLSTFDLVLDTVPAGSVTVGDTSFDYPPASTTTLGVVELATQAEMDAGTDPTRVPPVAVVKQYVDSSGFPSGTSMLFFDAAAPLGWTKSITHDNKAIRIVNTGGGGAGGAVDFSAAFASKSVSGTIANTTAGGTITVDNKTLSLSQIPAHGHDLGNSNQTGSNINALFYGERGNLDNETGSKTFNAGSGSSHNHTGSFSGNAHAHTFSGAAIDMNVKYVNAIICVRD